MMGSHCGPPKLENTPQRSARRIAGTWRCTALGVHVHSVGDGSSPTCPRLRWGCIAGAPYRAANKSTAPCCRCPYSWPQRLMYRRIVPCATGVPGWDQPKVQVSPPRVFLLPFPAHSSNHGRREVFIPGLTFACIGASQLVHASPALRVVQRRLALSLFLCAFVLGVSWVFGTHPYSLRPAIWSRPALTRGETVDLHLSLASLFSCKSACPIVFLLFFSFFSGVFCCCYYFASLRLAAHFEIPGKWRQRERKKKQRKKKRHTQREGGKKEKKKKRDIPLLACLLG